MVELKAPVEKLPLAVRKSVRDEFEGNKAEWESKISTLLGTAWTIEVNTNLIFAYAEDSYAKDRLGICLAEYIKTTIQNLEKYLKDFGDDGKAELNSLVSEHKITIHPDDTGKISYSGCDIKDGILRILFGAAYLGTNISDATYDLGKVVSATPARSTGLNLAARNGIAANYEAKIGALREELAEILKAPALKITPNFEANYAKLSTGEDPPYNFDERLGESTFSYLEGLREQLKRHGFAGDEMMQEGFADGVSKLEIGVRVVDKLVHRSYNESIIEDGVLWIQTTVPYWTTNINDAADNVLDLL